MDRWNLKSYRVMIYLLEIEITFLVNLIVTFWNCCFALFKSSLRCTGTIAISQNAVEFMARKEGVTIDALPTWGRLYARVGLSRCYRGPRRKIRPQQPRLLPLFLFLTYSLSAPLPPYSHSFPSRPDELALLFHVREKIRDFPRVRIMKEAIRRQSYIPTLYTGRIPDVNTYNRRKVQTSVPWPSIRSCCRELPC